MTLAIIWLDAAVPTLWLRTAARVTEDLWIRLYQILAN